MINLRIWSLTFMALVLVFVGFKSGEWIDALFTYKDIAERVIEPVQNIQEEEDDDEQLNEDNRMESVYLESLRNYYKVHNPNRMGEVPMILSRYAGKEAELFARLEKKYKQPVSIISESKQDTAMNSKIETLKHDTDESEEEEEVENDDEEIENKPKMKIKSWGEDDDPLPSEEKATTSFENEGEQEDEVNDEPEGAEGSGYDNNPPDSYPSVQDDVTPVVNPISKVKLIVVGFPGTGIEVVRSFLRNGLHWSVTDTLDGLLEPIWQQREGLPEFNLFNSFDAVVGDSVSLFFQEISSTYPDAKVVVTVRSIDSWLSDWKKLDSTSKTISKLTGGKTGDLTWLQRRYESFYDLVLNTIPSNKRVLINVHEGLETNHKNQWFWLSHFLQVPFPEAWTSTYSTISDSGSVSSDWLESLHRYSSNRKGSNGQLKVLGIGMDSTGEDALATALKTLGFKVAQELVHTNSCPECHIVTSNFQSFIANGSPNPNFGYAGMFHGIDAFVSPLAGHLVLDVLEANPDLKIIVTFRSLKKWTPVVRCKQHHSATKSHDSYIYKYYQALFGEAEHHSYIAKKRYFDYLDILHRLPPDRFISIDISKSGPSGEAWSSICSFLRRAKCTQQLMASSFPAVDHGSHCK